LKLGVLVGSQGSKMGNVFWSLDQCCSWFSGL